MSDTAGPGIALFGCGNWGSNHVRVWAELGVLRVVCDADTERLAKVAAEHPDVRTVTSPAEVFADGTVAAAVIATPAVTHAELALQAIEAGKHVFIEKPMAISVAEAQRVADAADREQRVLMVNHVLEYHPAVLALRDLITQGQLGKVLYLYSNRLNLGRVRTEENALWSFAPHDAALMLRLVGSAPTQVSCTGEAFLSRGVADVTLMSLSFPGNVQGHVFVSWLHPFKEHRFVVVGDKQMAVFDDTAPWSEKLVLYPHRVDWVDGRVPVARRAEGAAVPLQEGEPLLAACEHFLQAIRTDTRPLTDSVSALAVMTVLEAADTSLRDRGTPVQLAQAASDAVHPTALVDEGAELGEGTRVWHFSHVMSGATIGRDCSLGQNVFVAAGVRIGDRVRIQNNVSVYEGVELEDGVFCGPSVVFTNVINPRAEVSRKDEYRRTVVRHGASLGANSTIVCGVDIGRYAFVGAGAVVTSDIPDHALVVGVPARIVGVMCRCGERLPDGAADDATLTCSACGRSYTRTPEGGAQETP